MSTIRRLFGRTRQERRSSNALAMPLFPKTDAPDMDAALRWVRQEFSDSPSIGDLEGEDGTFTAKIPGGQFAVTFVAAPVPSGDLRGPVALAWHWPAAASIVEAHIAHQICFATSSELDAIDLKLLHSRIIAGIVSTSGASGVYVGSSLLVREADAYTSEMAEANRSSLPLTSWLGFNPVTEGCSRSAYTTGLRDFDLLELEAHNSAREWPDLFGLLADVAHYEIASGIQIGDGETLGGSDSERMLVRHIDSQFIPETKVACIAA